MTFVALFIVGAVTLFAISVYRGYQKEVKIHATISTLRVASKTINANKTKNVTTTADSLSTHMKAQGNNFGA